MGEFDGCLEKNDYLCIRIQTIIINLNYIWHEKVYTICIYYSGHVIVQL